jgi:hypothetical protein
MSWKNLVANVIYRTPISYHFKKMFNVAVNNISESKVHIKVFHPIA